MLTKDEKKAIKSVFSLVKAVDQNEENIGIVKNILFRIDEAKELAIKDLYAASRNKSIIYAISGFILGVLVCFTLMQVPVDFWGGIF